MCYIYTMKYYSAIKTNEIMAFAATWMDQEIVTLSEGRQRRTNAKSKKMVQMNLLTNKK